MSKHRRTEPCCNTGHAGPFERHPVKFPDADVVEPVTRRPAQFIDAEERIEVRCTDPSVDGFGWPPFLPWGQTEKIIDSLVDEQGPWTIGEPKFGYTVEPGPEGTVYLAGPMRGRDQFNFPAFHNAAWYLREQGWGVFDPAEYDEHHGFDASGYDGTEDLAAIGFDLRESLGADLAFIAAHADAVAVLPGWETSRGATAEVAAALALGLRVFDAWGGADINELPAKPSPITFTFPLGHVDPRQADLMHGIDATEPGLVNEPAPCCGFGCNCATKPVTIEQNVILPTRVDPRLTDKDISLDGEVRTVSASGGQKGVKPEVYDQIPVNALAELARHFGYGAAKYSAHNFRKGYEWDKNFNAAMRHAWAFWGGEDYDLHKPDCAADCTDHLPNSKHVIAAAWHFMVLATFMDEHPEYDTRYKPEASA